MVRIIVGACLMVLFVLSVIGDKMSEPSEQFSNAELGLCFFLFFIPGLLLLIFGFMFINKYKTVIEVCLQEKKNDNTIDSKEVAENVGMSLLKVNKYISIAKRKGEISPKTRIV